MAEVLDIDRSDDGFGKYETHWLCAPPADGAVYTVIEEEWNNDYSVRTIKKVELQNVWAGTPGEHWGTGTEGTDAHAQG